MRIERIGENKIKVMVNGDDIRMWNVDLKNFTDNTPEAQDMFWFALKQAEQDVNFTVGQSQLLVETMPAGDEGYVLVISRLESETDVAEALVRAGKQVKQTEFKVRRRHRMAPLLRIYRFEDFEELCQGIAQIHELYMGASRLFKYQGGFFLELVPIDAVGFFEIDNIVSEFSEKVRKPVIMQGVLNEHGQLMMAAEAVENIARNFVN
ncbi:MAG: adaptor protein MecA [Clostridia bacterium]|nr:adaptor protein MecA [Clostridia bacterium]